MRELPPISDTTLLTSLCQHYGLSTSELTFLPLGFDVAVGVYRVLAADGQCYFLKVRRGPVAEITLRLPRYLCDQGMPQVVAPLPTLAHTLWAQTGEFTLVLYPFLDGQAGMDVGLSHSQWTELGTALTRLHTTRLPPDLAAQVRVEDFLPNPSSAAIIRQLQATIHERAASHPTEQSLITFWQEWHAQIALVLARAEALGRRLQSSAPPLVLCHADIHTANVLLTSNGQLFIVDWDQPIFAPKERDLMFVVDDVVGSPETIAAFFQGYGAAGRAPSLLVAPATVPGLLPQLDPLALAYYRYEWAVQDIGAFAAQALDPEGSEPSRAEGLRWFQGKFAPGGSVETAQQLDELFFR